MRAIAIFLSILLALPLVHGLAPLTAAPAPAHADLALPPSPPDPLALPDDLTDAALVLLLARHVGLDPRPLTAPPPPADATVQTLALKLAHRSGAPHATSADFTAFAQLDPAIAAPTLTLLHALDTAWTLRDAALAGIPPEDQHELAALVLAGDPHHPRAAQLGEPLDRTALVEAAILLLDAAENVAIPQLRQAAATAPWPAQPLFDPIGILRIGGTGDDVEHDDRLLQIDPRGNDTYHNNAGGTTLLADLKVETLDYPVALSVDLEGDDNYTFRRDTYISQGAAFLGVGIALDLEGDDYYDCLLFCHGSGVEGVGLLRDHRGNDAHFAADAGLGYGSGMGVTRDDGGDDGYRAGGFSGGYGFSAKSLGLLWDRNGLDTYYTLFRMYEYRYGWGEEGGRGYFADEGPDLDNHVISSLGGHACNTCTWQHGTHGHGNDNTGGLAFLLTRQDHVA